MVKEEGVLAFWKGHMSAQYLSAIYMTIQFTGVDAFTRKAHKTFPNAHESKFQTSFIMGCGGVFGATMATSVSFPFDVIRTRTIAQHTTNLKAQCCSVSFWQRAWQLF
jgi:solute carrier family 25 thiamine pyrophosphate transporter 19